MTNEFNQSIQNLLMSKIVSGTPIMEEIKNTLFGKLLGAYHLVLESQEPKMFSMVEVRSENLAGMEETFISMSEIIANHDLAGSDGGN